MTVIANLILLIVAAVCLGTGEVVQGCLFLIVSWFLSILTRREDSNETL